MKSKKFERKKIYHNFPINFDLIVFQSSLSLAVKASFSNKGTQSKIDQFSQKTNHTLTPPSNQFFFRFVFK